MRAVKDGQAAPTGEQVMGKDAQEKDNLATYWGQVVERER